MLALLFWIAMAFIVCRVWVGMGYGLEDSDND